jgi:hypothetical protein
VGSRPPAASISGAGRDPSWPDRGSVRIVVQGGK